MWVAHHTAVSHWLLMEKPSTLNLVLVNNGGGSCNLLGGLRSSHRSNGAMARKSGNLALSLTMTAFDRNRITSCSDVTFYGNSRIACQQDYIILVPVTTVSHTDIAKCSHNSFSFPQRELNFKFRLQQGWNSTHRVLRQLWRLKASSGSPKDGTGMFQSLAILSSSV